MAESEKARPKYVWDRDKLAWVEAAPDQTEAEAARDTGAIEETFDRAAEEVPAGVSLVEPAVEEYEGPQIKGAWSRVGALAIDFILLAIVNLVIGLVLDVESGGVTRYVAPSIGVVYFVAFWAWRGQTIGKIMVGAQIVKVDGSPIGIGRAFLRYIGYFIYLTAIQYSVLVGWYLAILVALVIFLFVALSRDKRGLHDRLAGTIVISTRSKTLEAYADEAYDEDEPTSYPEAEQETFVSERA